MLCPKCQLEQPDGNAECLRCGVLFARLREREAAGGSVYRPPSPAQRTQYDQALGGLSYGLGRLSMLAAFAWGGWVLARERRLLRESRLAVGSWKE